MNLFPALEPFYWIIEWSQSLIYRVFIVSTIKKTQVSYIKVKLAFYEEFI